MENLPKNIRCFIPVMMMMTFTRREEKMFQRLFKHVNGRENQIDRLRERRYGLYTSVSEIQ